MAYDIAVQGLQDFHRLDGVLARRKIPRDPLTGVVDGVNKVFYTNYFPILSSGSLYVYDGANLMPGTADIETGEITTGSAPSTQPLATYTYTPYSVSQQLSFLINGFLTMEGEWSRGLVLKDASGNYADENSQNIYIQDSGGGDPLTGSYVQQAFYMACCRYNFLVTQLTGAAITDFDWRETVRGMAVNKSKRPDNLSKAIDQARIAMGKAMEAAQAGFYDGSNLGAYIGNPVTQTYAHMLEWQTNAKNMDYRDQRGQWLMPLTI